VVSIHFDSAAKRAAIELWKTKVPQRTIIIQLGSSNATLMKIMKFAKVDQLF
jgi:hypothetical protein